ncbi:MAG: hypothetical protein NT166_31920 [Candidatus Aminicenantes bacterium]|nr:hypothetical protein [Candidatus Aminicenantes bacterium]
MNKKFEVIFILLVIVIMGSFLFAGVTNPTLENEKTRITTYYMYPGQNKLVVDEPTEKSAGKQMVKIFFNDKDYTRFAEKLLASQPLCFASCRVLVFGKKKMVLKNKQWQCKKGILFIPGEKEILVIDASRISLDEDEKILNIRSGKVKHIALDTNLEVEKEQQKIIMDLSKG